MTIHECQICERYTGSKSQVRAHIQGSKGDHEGIGFNEADNHIAETDKHVEQQGQQSGGSESKGTGEASSPSSPSSPGMPKNKDAKRQTSNPDCPNCSSELYHRNELDTSRYRLENNDADYACLNCGKEYKDE